MRNYFGFILAGAFLAFTFINLAHAELTFCNRTNSAIEFAISKPGAGGIRHDSGWFKISPGQCKDVIKTSLTASQYYYFARMADGSHWTEDQEGFPGISSCIDMNGDFSIRDSTCPPGSVIKKYKRINVGDHTTYKLNFTDTETMDFSIAEDRSKACEILQQNLEKPKLQPQRIVIGSYTDLLTPPQTKTECTNVYDTGVPDVSTCATEYDSCASRIDLPFGGWTCAPGTTTRCSNIKTCNTWRTDIKTMECDLVFQIKLPNYIDKPLSEFIDTSYNIINSAKDLATTSLPLQCAPQASHSNNSTTQAVAQQIANDLVEKVRDAIRREAEQWLKETAIKTIIASIPSGGIGGGAVMSTELAQFVYKVHNALKPIIETANDVKDFAEDIGFNTSCGWSDWHQF